jgi:hypothetical protein
MEVEEARAQLTPPTRASQMSAPWRMSSSQVGSVVRGESTTKFSDKRRLSMASLSRRESSRGVLDQMSPLHGDMPSWDDVIEQPLDIRALKH